MLDFFSRFFRREGSSATAKERLRLVLLSDHLSLAPETVEALKRELIDVISRYVKIDTRMCEVSFEQEASNVAMRANIPILGLHSDRPAVAPPVLVDPPRGAAAKAANEGPGYLDALHSEVHKASTTPSPFKPDTPEEQLDIASDDSSTRASITN